MNAYPLRGTVRPFVVEVFDSQDCEELRMARQTGVCPVTLEVVLNADSQSYIAVLGRLWSTAPSSLRCFLECGMDSRKEMFA